MKQMRRLRSIAVLLAIIACAANATPPSNFEFEQHLNAHLPLDARFVDANGRALRLREAFDDRAVILVLGYYQCRMLCSTLMEGVLQTLSTLRLSPDRYRIVAVSIDPHETPQIALEKQRVYARIFPGANLRLLTGNADAIASLTRIAGFDYRYDSESQQYLHPAGFIVATPSGNISHYFLGVRFNAADVHAAIDDAAAERIGAMVDRLVLLCAHFDATVGRYSMTVMNAVRIGCATVLAGLGLWLWRHHARRKSM